ncbi:acyl-CoA dehydrogenase, partial [Pseudomonas aeruginosa]|nr:acyl-CoA dehydrogenase [Pseudomonas aeruginosa]
IEAGLVAPLLPEDERVALLAAERLVLPAGIAYRDGRRRPRMQEGRLHGEVAHVHLAGAADAWLVACEQGLALVERDADGVELLCEATQDGAHLARLRFRDAPARWLSGEVAEQVLDEAALACAAYLVGLMDGAFERTLEYLKVRRQFGREIGSFQALQHRMVDLRIQIELSRAMVEQAAAAIDAGASESERQRQVSSARVRASEAALLVTRQAIQLHGGIGYTDEADIGLFLRRAMVLLNAHGSLAFHKARYAALLQREVA